SEKKYFIVCPSDVLRLLKQPAGPTRTAVRAADYMDVAVKLIKRSLNRRPKRSINATDLISEEDLEVIADLTGCSPRHRVPSCTTTPNLNKFRTASSTCNNRENTRWGSSNIPFTRWLPAEYEDGTSLPKGWTPNLSVNRHLLPLVREVSNRILRTANSDVESDPLYTHLVTIFGQWTDHDLTFTPHSPVIRSFNNGVDCDKSCERTEPCFPIEVLTFRDYLLHIVGPDFIARQLSTYPGYDENVDPSISNVFATAAYRFAHLMVQPFMFRLDEKYKENSKFPSPLLHKAFFAPWRIVFEGGVDPILRGLVGRQAKLNTQDQMMTDELRDRLFKFSAELALDLGALNMQRGRDHGLPGYNQWRKFCGLSQPRNLAQLARVMNNTDLAKNLLDLYGTPDNIDVWLGGVAEPFVRGGRVGPLFACLIATQFQKIRQGDRLWWENEGVFTEAQRESLRETSLARIMCDNTGITEVPDRPFQYRPRGSGYTQCEDIPTFDLSPWREGDYDTKTGIFTCEHPGVYEFQFHCTINKNDASVDLLRNGELIVHSFTTRQNGYITASGNTYVKLQKGDKVWLMANHGSNGLTKDSFFSGHLLFTE
uniref:Eosinophil peroxidase n=1 Tax=Seriola lalandi dorsalis TaxID=1841481 RepID=A0A3B4YEW5_SERLL